MFYEVPSVLAEPFNHWDPTVSIAGLDSLSCYP